MGASTALEELYGILDFGYYFSRSILRANPRAR